MKFFKDKKFYSSLFKIALPIMLQYLIVSSLNMVDTLMIGKVGEKEIAAVGIANQYFFFFNILIGGVFSACGMYISQFWGNKDEKSIKRVVGVGNVIGIAASIIFMAIAIINPEGIIRLFNSDTEVVILGSKYLSIVIYSYLFTAITFNYAFASRCVENPKLPMMVSAIALVTNAIFNYILIFGHLGFEPMGVEGAAIATLIARIVEVIALISIIYMKKGVLASKKNELLYFKKEFIRKMYKTISAVVLNEACWGLGTVLYAAVYGRISTEALAAVQICSPITNLFMVITFGISNAAIVMVGNRIGASEIDEAKDFAKKFLKLGCGIGVLLAIVLAASSPIILSFYSGDISEGVLKSAQNILYITSLILTIRTFNVILIIGVLRGGGDANYGLFIEAFTMWCIGVPVSIFGAFVLKLDVEYVVALVTLEEIAKFILGYLRVKKGKWVKVLVSSM